MPQNKSAAVIPITELVHELRKKIHLNVDCLQ